jgi:hypothetical protein
MFAHADVTTNEESATSPGQQVATTTDAEASDRLVCKRVTPTGSKISRKECRRQSEIDSDRRNARDSVDTMQRKAVGQTTTSD